MLPILYVLFLGGGGGEGGGGGGVCGGKGLVTLASVTSSTLVT